MNNMYSPSELIKNVYYFIMTKLTFPKARFIRRPIYIRGKKLITGAEGLTTGRFCRFDLAGDKPSLHIGKNCSFGDMTHIVAHESVIFGDNVLIASKCFISDTSHGAYKGIDQSAPIEAPMQRRLVSKPVKIGDNVWIGENVVILSGADIGSGCIIGANAIVKGIIPENCMCAGIPAVIIKKWDDVHQLWVKV